MSNDNIFGEMVLKYMKKNGWTMKELGEKVNRGESTVSMWISGKSTPPMGIVQKLADLFNISTDSMIYGESEYNQFGNDQANIEYPHDKPELLEIYNEIKNRDDIYLLFDKTKDLEPKDVESVLLFVQTIRKQRGLDE